MKIIHYVDLKDPDDDKGRTYREVNNATKHKFEVGQLIEFLTGVRLFIYRQTRDCDGTPLYTLTDIMDDPNNTLLYGYAEEGLIKVD